MHFLNIISFIFYWKIILKTFILLFTRNMWKKGGAIDEQQCDLCKFRHRYIQCEDNYR